MNFKSILPRQYGVESVQKNLFKLGFTWEDETTKVYPWNEVSEYYLFLDMENKLLYLRSRYMSIHNFFKSEAQYIDYSNLLYDLDRIKKHDWDQQQYDNMVYWEKEGYKYEL